MNKKYQIVWKSPNKDKPKAYVQYSTDKEAVTKRLKVLFKRKIEADVWDITDDDWNKKERVLTGRVWQVDNEWKWFVDHDRVISN